MSCTSRNGRWSAKCCVNGPESRNGRGIPRTNSPGATDSTHRVAAIALLSACRRHKRVRNYTRRPRQASASCPAGRELWQGYDAGEWPNSSPGYFIPQRVKCNRFIRCTCPHRRASVRFFDNSTIRAADGRRSCGLAARIFRPSIRAA